jgi:hypothetical protein
MTDCLIYRPKRPVQTGKKAGVPSGISPCFTEDRKCLQQGVSPGGPAASGLGRHTRAARNCGAPDGTSRRIPSLITAPGRRAFHVRFISLLMGCL